MDSYKTMVGMSDGTWAEADSGNNITLLKVYADMYDSRGFRTRSIESY